MNSERRHELQQNYLADFLGTQLKKIENHTKLIAVVIAVVVFAAVAFGLYRSAAVGARSDATLELLQNSAAGDPEALGQVGDRYADTAAGALAKLYQADLLLSDGITALFDDREEAQTQLSEALRRYNEVAQGANGVLIRSRANFGLARTHESMGEFDQAITAYNRVIEIGESEAMIKAAQQRIDRLQSPETQEFFAWFERQDFRPADPAEPPGMPSGGSLPDLPDVHLPDLSPLAPAGEAPAEDPADAPATDPAAPAQLDPPQGEAAQPPGDETLEPAPPAEQPVGEPAEPAEAASEPSEPVAEPAPEPIQSVDDSAEPTAEPTEPTEPVQPAELADEPAEPAAEPAEPVVEVEPTP